VDKRDAKNDLTMARKLHNYGATYVYSPLFWQNERDQSTAVFACAIVYIPMAWNILELVGFAK